MPNNKNTIDALIFLGVARAKVQLKKAIKAGNAKNSKIKLGFEFYLDGNLRNPKNSFLPRANEIHGVPAFKKSCIRELIYQIADNNFWHQYYKGFRYNIVEGAYKSKLHSPDVDSAIQQSVIFKFNFAPDIKISKNCYAERSILLRIVYALSGHNPYPENELNDIERKIKFEIAMLKSSIRRLEAFHELGLNTFDVNSNVAISFTIALREFLDLLKNSEKALEGLFILWKKDSGMDLKEHSTQLIFYEKHKNNLNQNEILQRTEENIFNLLHIERDLVLKIWGGTLKSFNRIQKDKQNKPSGEAVILTYEHPSRMSNVKKMYLKKEDAIKFLESRGIDWTLKNGTSPDDFSYKYIADLEKKIREDSADLTMKNAIDAWENYFPWSNIL